MSDHWFRPYGPKTNLWPKFGSHLGFLTDFRWNQNKNPNECYFLISYDILNQIKLSPGMCDEKPQNCLAIAYCYYGSDIFRKWWFFIEDDAQVPTDFSLPIGLNYLWQQGVLHLYYIIWYYILTYFHSAHNGLWFLCTW